VLKPRVAVIVAALLVLFGTVIACSDDEKQADPGTESPGPSSTYAAARPSVTSYVDPTYGYSFEYPATWYLAPLQDNGGQVILYSYDFNGAVGDGRPVPKDKLKAFFWVAEGVDQSLEQWLAGGRAKASAEQNLSPPTVISQAPTALGQKEGLVEVTESDGFASISYYATLDGGRVFVVNAGPADSERLAEFEGVLATLQFAPSNQKEAGLPGGTSATVMYTNPVYGYSLEYPSDWFLRTDPGGYVTITSYDIAKVGPTGPFPAKCVQSRLRRFREHQQPQS